MLFYRAFIMTLANFITIQFALLSDKLIFFFSIFSNILIFAVISIRIYLLFLLREYCHRKNQLSVEQEALVNNNIMDSTMRILQFEYLEGKLTE